MNYHSIEYSFCTNIHSYLGIQGPWFEIKFKEANTAQPEFLLTKGLTLPEIYQGKGYFGRTKAYSLELFEEDSIALIEYNTCPMGFGINALKKFMEDSFREIREKNIKHVFVDITRNGGGGGDEVNIYLYNKLNHEAHNWKSVKYEKKKNPERMDTVQIRQCTETIRQHSPVLKKRLPDLLGNL